MNKKKENKENKEISANHDHLMLGFINSPFFNHEPQMSHGRYIQLSAYKEKRTGMAVTIGSSSITLNK